MPVAELFVTVLASAPAPPTIPAVNMDVPRISMRIPSPQSEPVTVFPVMVRLAMYTLKLSIPMPLRREALNELLVIVMLPALAILNPSSVDVEPALSEKVQRLSVKFATPLLVEEFDGVNVQPAGITLIPVSPGLVMFI